ncbi:MAG: hypothetical protein EBW83_07370, partial [Rhodobacterales bacterium]|nr:hypothetical protein [Rhodobacterales bacterium]
LHYPNIYDVIIVDGFYVKVNYRKYFNLVNQLILKLSYKFYRNVKHSIFYLSKFTRAAKLFKSESRFGKGK